MIGSEDYCRKLLKLSLEDVPSTAPHLFSHSVSVRTEPPSDTRSVDTAEAAVEELLNWTERGPKWNLAVRVCIVVIADKMEAEEARKAFLAAAREEEVLRSSD